MSCRSTRVKIRDWRRRCSCYCYRLLYLAPVVPLRRCFWYHIPEKPERHRHAILNFYFSSKGHCIVRMTLLYRTLLRLLLSRSRRRGLGLLVLLGRYPLHQQRADDSRSRATDRNQ